LAITGHRTVPAPPGREEPQRVRQAGHPRCPHPGVRYRGAWRVGSAWSPGTCSSPGR